jgi:hypothetical protein
MSDVQVKLLADNQLSPELLDAAKHAKRLADEEKKLTKAGEKLGINSKALARGLAASRSEQAKLARVAKEHGAAQTKMLKAFAQGKVIEGAFGDQAGATSEILGKSALAAAGITLAITAAVAGAGALLVGLGKVAAAAGESRQNSVAMLDALTGGGGEKSLGELRKLAKNLGSDFKTVEDQFIRFRKAGLTNKQSGQLIKLTADLKAAKYPTEALEEAISEVLNPQEGESTAAALQRIADKAKVAGDGTGAAAKNVESIAGAMNRIDNKKTEVLEALWTKIGPSVERAANAVADALIKFADSKEGKATIENLGNAIIKLADFVTKTAGPALDVFGPILGGVSLQLRLVASAAELAYNATVKVANAVKSAAGVISGGKAQMEGSGKMLATGIIGGFVSGNIPGALGGIAAAAGAQIAKVWKIASPSKLGKELGGFLGKGLTIGAEEEAPSGKDIARAAAPTPAQMQQSGGSVGGSGSGVSIVIQNISVPAGADSAAFARDIRRELSLYLETLRMSGGLPSGGLS